MDKTIGAVVIAGIVLIIVTCAIVYDASTDREVVTPPPFEPDVTMTPTETETAKPQCVPDAGNMDNHIVEVNKNGTAAEEWSICDPRHGDLHLRYWKCMGGSGSGRSAPPAAAQPIPEAETIAAVAFGLVAVVLVVYVRRAGK